MMRSFCRRMDAEGTAAYLETDKEENVGFYERYGFVVTGRDFVLGQPNWYMARPRPSTPA